MATVVYLLGGFVDLTCAVLLLRGYVRSGAHLLLLSSACFFGLSTSNFLIFVDLKILPQVDLYPVRLAIAAVAMLILVFGLVWEGEA